MERLNNIVSRTAQRRPQSIDQGSLESQAPQGEQVRQLPPRQRLPEQTARLGQQSLNHNLSPRPRNEQGSTREIQPRQSTSQLGRPTYPKSRSQANNPGGYQQYQKHPQHSQRPSQEPEYPLRRTVDDYYEGELRPPMPKADVQEEWGDDTAGMRYGDWESEGSGERRMPAARTVSESPVLPEENSGNQGESSIQRRTRLERYAAANRPLVTRELSSALDLESRPLPTRNLRDLRGTAPQPPAPQVPAQESRHTHRFTQPLNPQTIVRLSQDNPQEAHRIQQFTQQGTSRDQPALPMPQTLHSRPCPICKGAGYVRLDVPYGHPNFGKPIACECKEAERAEKRRQQLREMSNLGAFRDKSFKNFNPRVPGVQEAFSIALEYAQNPEGWLVFIGRNGCGKTHLAAAIANQNLARGSLVLFATVPDLLDHLRATFAPTSTVVYDQLFSTMREAELLILDDLGSEQNSPWASEKLFQLLNYRYNSRFPTVITTNNIRLQSVDERIRSRLMDRSLVTEVTFERAHDYRPHNPNRE